MCCGNEELSGITISMSRGAGTCVGTVAAAGKKITGVVTSGVKAAGHLLVRPVGSPELIAAEQTESTSEGFDVGARDKQQVEQESSAKSLISSLESDIVAATDKILFAKAVSDIASGEVAVRVDAVKTMAGVHHKLSVKAILAQAKTDTSAQVRQECIKALTAMEITEGLPAVKQALTDQAGSVRLAAVWGLYRLAGTESAPALLSVLSDKDEEVRRRAATCIGWLGQEELAGRLTPLLNDSSVSVRRAAVEAMGSLGNEQVVLSMIRHLKDPDKATRKIILGAIEKITGKKLGKSFPKNEVDMDRLIARWHEWWKEKLAR